MALADIKHKYPISKTSSQKIKHPPTILRES